MATVVFPQFLRGADFGAGSTATDVAITSGVYNIVGSKTVGAQQQLNWGVGVVGNGVDTRETATLRFDSATGEITGTYRLLVQDANGIQTIPVYENNGTNFKAGVKVGLTNPGAREDSKLLIQLKPDSSTTVDYSDSDNVVNLPVTVTNFS